MPRGNAGDDGRDAPGTPLKQTLGPPPASLVERQGQRREQEIAGVKLRRY
jgi:hypothetical protein